MDVLEIPGYAKEVLRERVIRDAAFLGITESIGPFEVVPMSLRHWLILRLMHSPLLTGDTPTPQDVFNFLWLLSTNYSATNLRSKRHFERRCRSMFFPPRYWALMNTRWARAWHESKRIKRLTVAARIIYAARAYVTEALQDRPPIQKSIGFDADYYSDAAYFCALFGREFGWSQDETLNMPVKRMFQFLNECRASRGSKTPLCNPSDRIKSQYLRSLQPKRPPHGH
jgi:hypothetical protein